MRLPVAWVPLCVRVCVSICECLSLSVSLSSSACTAESTCRLRLRPIRNEGTKWANKVASTGHWQQALQTSTVGDGSAHCSSDTCCCDRPGSACCWCCWRWCFLFILILPATVHPIYSGALPSVSFACAHQLPKLTVCSFVFISGAYNACHVLLLCCVLSPDGKGRRHHHHRHCLQFQLPLSFVLLLPATTADYLATLICCHYLTSQLVCSVACSRYTSLSLCSFLRLQLQLQLSRASPSSCAFVGSTLFLFFSLTFLFFGWCSASATFSSLCHHCCHVSLSTDNLSLSLCWHFQCKYFLAFISCVFA